MSSYDFDFLTDSREANKQATLLAKIRYNEQLAPFINSPNAKDHEARLKYASDHIERIIDECCEAVANSEREVVSSRLKTIIAKEVATTQPQKRNVTEQVGGESSPGNNGSTDVGDAVQQDILDRDAVLENEILDADATIDANTPLSEGEVQYPKVAGAAEEAKYKAALERIADPNEGTQDWKSQIALEALGRDPDSIYDYLDDPESSVKIACARCGEDCDCDGPVCTECGNFLAEKEAVYGQSQQPFQQYPTTQTAQQVQPPVTQQPAQPNNQQMKCDVCGFVGNAQQVQDHNQKMVAANDQLHMNTQPGGNQPVQPGQVQASMVKEAPGKKHLPYATPKRNRQYEHVLASCRKEHPEWSEDRCKELAARTVNKERRRKGELKSSNSKVAAGEQDFLADEHNHGQEDRAEGDPVREDYEDKDEAKDPADRFDAIVQDIADHAAAKRYSQATEEEIQQIASRYGLSSEEVKSHLHIISLFGDYTGLNGDIVNSDPNTDGLTEINDQDLGGQQESHEALVPLEKAVQQTSEAINMTEQMVYDRIQEAFGGSELPDEYHASVEGQRNFYLPSSLVSATDSDISTQQTGQPQQ